MQSLIILICTLRFPRLLCRVTIPLAFDLPPHRILFPISILWTVFSLLSESSCLYFDAQQEQKAITTNTFEVLRNRRLHLKTAGEQWWADIVGNNENIISFQLSHCQSNSQAQEWATIDEGQSHCHSESQAHPSATEVIGITRCCPQQMQCVLGAETRNQDYQSEILLIKQLLLVQPYGIKILAR